MSYGSRQRITTSNKRPTSSHEIKEALEFYKTQGLFMDTMPEWKDQNGNVYKFTELTDHHLGNLIPYIERRRTASMRAERANINTVNILKAERLRRKDLNIDDVRHRVANQLTL